LVSKIIATFGLASLYTFGVRPRLLRWRDTDQKVESPFRGSDIVPEAKRGATMVITIDAPPSSVWPWLVQMGTNRVGGSELDRVDNWGCKSAESIHLEWQKLSLSECLLALPSGKEGWDVAALEPGRFLCLRASIDQMGHPYGTWHPNQTDSTWGFVLEKLPADRTRLVVTGYWHLEPTWLQPLLSVLLLET
jgi:proline iminopeptidase